VLETDVRKGCTLQHPTTHLYRIAIEDLPGKDAGLRIAFEADLANQFSCVIRTAALNRPRGLQARALPFILFRSRAVVSNALAFVAGVEVDVRFALNFLAQLCSKVPWQERTTCVDCGLWTLPDGDKL
jgi:hypothetical protein